MSMTSAVGKWHHERYRGAPDAAVALKLAEEVGELIRAINGEIGVHDSADSGSVYDELGDVLIVATVIAHRHGWTIGDVLADRFATVAAR